LNLTVNEVYDPATDSWTTKAPIPIGVSGYASAVVDNKIYVIGGYVGRNYNQIYDVESDTWSQGAPLPVGVGGAAAGATTGVNAPKKIYVIGGYQNLDPVDFNQIYDPETDTWDMGAQMPTPRGGLDVAVINDILYAIGGIPGWFKPATGANELYVPFGFMDQKSPTISIISPENKTYTTNNISLKFTVDEPTSWIAYNLDGQANVTIEGNTFLRQLPYGLHSIVIYAKDIAGNIGVSEKVYFTIAQESENPLIWIVPSITIILGGVVALIYLKKFREKRGKQPKDV
ncbi:hypothetical protein H5T51_03170, partial [Candidatus Bathyarchaeota archaeon]|nr:hypothetical protein [Candidatus Bathyarchaeota archaeon]